MSLLLFVLSIRLQSSYQTTAVAKAQNLIKVGLFVDWFFVFDRFVEGISLKENYKHKNGKEFLFVLFLVFNPLFHFLSIVHNNGQT
jgi:hypothetical protein